MTKQRKLKFKFWNGKRMFQPTEYADLLIKGDGRIFCWLDIDENSGLAEVTDQGFIPLQFTGLVDRKGKEIYEGDIIFDDTTDYIWAVKWNYEASGWANAVKNPYDFGLYGDLEKCFEVIGNIYENTELYRRIKCGKGKGKR